MASDSKKSELVNSLENLNVASRTEANPRPCNEGYIDIHSTTSTVSKPVEEIGETVPASTLRRASISSEEEYLSAEDDDSDLDLKGAEGGIEAVEEDDTETTKTTTEDSIFEETDVNNVNFDSAEEEKNEKDEEAAEEERRRKIEESLTEEEKMERKDQAQEEKGKGNELYKSGQLKEAVFCYSKALDVCPFAFPKERAIMFSNRAACKLRLEEYDTAIKDCSKALELHPQYLKALLRRAELYEKTEKLDEALADYKKALELDPSQHSARAACVKLGQQINERNEKMKEEMLGKLKELGNTILRPFGLSTNNFQLNQDPNTGSYSVQFKQN